MISSKLSQTYLLKSEIDVVREKLTNHSKQLNSSENLLLASEVKNRWICNFKLSSNTTIEERFFRSRIQIRLSTTNRLNRTKVEVDFIPRAFLGLSRLQLLGMFTIFFIIVLSMVRYEIGSLNVVLPFLSTAVILISIILILEVFFNGIVSKVNLQLHHSILELFESAGILVDYKSDV
ncbi:hypothetical protein BBFL7_02345 [Flavobacteria bacterium BBFL7]|nr:hypothetical protein BBFL7_02345 [Flavobacteria bacterium BBFL7]